MHDPASWFRKTWFTRRRVRELKNAHNSVTVQNRTHVYMNFFHHKDLGNHLLQLCPKVVKHLVYIHTRRYTHVFIHTYIHTYTHMYATYMGIYMYVNTLKCTFMCVLLYVQHGEICLLYIYCQNNCRIRLTMTCLAFDGDVSLIPSLPMTNISALCY